MEEIKYATPEQLRSHIEKATRDVASWPLWKADPDIILSARKKVKKWDEKKMEDEVLAKILEALESIDKRLAILELRSIYSPYESSPWNPIPPITYIDNERFNTGDPFPLQTGLPTTTCKTEE